MKILCTSVACAVLAVAAPTAAHAATLVVNVAGAQSNSAFGGTGNTVRSFNIGAGSYLTAVSYSVNITAFSPSYLSEATLAFTDAAITNGVFLTPGFGVDASGTATYTSTVDLVGEGLDFAVGADGFLRLEWFEDFADSGVNPDAIWNTGTVTFTYTPSASAVPEPAGWAMMIGGFGLVGGAMRRRKSNVRTSVRFA